MENWQNRLLKGCKGLCLAGILSCIVTLPIHADEATDPVNNQKERMIIIEPPAEVQTISVSEHDSIAVEEAPVEESTIFADVPADYWAREGIEALYQLDALTYEKVEEHLYFHGEQPVTRAELSKMVLVAKGIDLTKKQTAGTFKDVPADAWYTPYVNAAYQLGIFGSVTEETFGPEQSVSRLDGIAGIVRAIGAREDVRVIDEKKRNQFLSKFVDRKEIPTWGTGHLAEQYMTYAVINGMHLSFHDDADNRLAPNQAMTKAEAAMLVYNIIHPKLSTLKVAEVDGNQVYYHRSIQVESTAYSGEDPGISDYTALGFKTRRGIVAVDPKVIPLGTHLYIQGYGYGVAADRGGAIKGNKVDVFLETRREALQYGRKHHVKVFILNNDSFYEEKELVKR